MNDLFLQTKTGKPWVKVTKDMFRNSGGPIIKCLYTHKGTGDGIEFLTAGLIGIIKLF